ncbi:hypothetical protein POM88_015008 [Heracleum sosnowskyi]|uniref:Uncharacterized protein n=1 Tax=Heracleum sosnowskyi TaxID=360622 RepID=A0AAD8IMT5_9APIA|nr:hypothetical protein POM88_015008 [Heracleum sosnowskyi]
MKYYRASGGIDSGDNCVVSDASSMEILQDNARIWDDCLCIWKNSYKAYCKTPVPQVSLLVLPFPFSSFSLFDFICLHVENETGKEGLIGKWLSVVVVNRKATMVGPRKDQPFVSRSGEAPDEYKMMHPNYNQGLLSPDKKQQLIKHVNGMIISTQCIDELSEQEEEEEEQLINGRRYQQGIEYIQPSKRSGLPGRHRLKDEDQQAIEYIRRGIRSGLPGQQRIKNEYQQAMEYNQPPVRSMRPEPNILKYEDQQGIEHIRGAERSMCYDHLQVPNFVIQTKSKYIPKDHRQGWMLI